MIALSNQTLFTVFEDSSCGTAAQQGEPQPRRNVWQGAVRLRRSVWQRAARLRRSVRQACSAVLGVMLLACGSAGTAELEVDTNGWADSEEWAQQLAASSAHDAAVAWGPCPDGFASECATLRVPLDWQRPGRGSIEVFISRYPALNPQRRQVGQLWLLTGGPGGSVEALTGDFDRGFLPWRQDYDIYTMEQRGIGGSTRLGCPEQEAPDTEEAVIVSVAEAKNCGRALQVQWGEDLGAFNVTNTARDLKYAIYRTKARANQRVFLWGVSYGTLLLQRFLQVAPNHVSGVMLDSVLTPTRDIFDKRFYSDRVMRDLSAWCDRDAVCSAKLGGNAWAFITATLAKLDDPTHCPSAGWDSFAFGDATNFLVDDRAWRPVLFALLYRLARCNTADQAIIRSYQEAVAPFFEPPTTPQRFSDGLAYNIGASELAPPHPPSLATIERDCRAQAFCRQFEIDRRRIYEVWPHYRLDRYARRWAESKTPILAMNGDLDPLTPYQDASKIRDHLRGPQQNYVQFPVSNHVVLDQTQVRTPGQLSCAVQVMWSFTEHPSRRPNTSCLADLVPVTFEIDPGDALYLFGQEDLWENPTPSPAPAPLARASSRPALSQGIVQHLRRARALQD